jgi:transposase InsO family protein
MAVSETILDHVYRTLKDLKDGQVRPAAKALAAHYGVSEQTIYRYAGTRGLRWRKEKATKGTSRVSRDALVKASALLLASRRSKGHIIMPGRDAKEILEDSGIDTGGVSTSWFLTRMRQESLSGRDLARPSPHAELLSDHPNHVWQFDVTNCTQYFLDDKKGMGERDTELELSKNKIVKTAKSIRRELLRYAAVDHCSGAFYFRYFYSSGERAIDGAQFLFEAMRPKTDLFPDAEGKYPMQGVPFILVTDKGSIAVAKANHALFEALRMQLITHMPGNPRAKGAIEGLMKHLLAFEARLKFRRPASLDELNRWAFDWCIYINGARDMRGVAPRSVLWATIPADKLRLCPDEKLYKLLMRQPVIEATANGSCHISVDGNTYRVPDTNAAYKKVKVVRHPFEYPSVEVHFNGFVWLCEPVEKDRYGRKTSGVQYGDYRAPKYTATQKARKEMEQVAAVSFGLAFKGTGDHRRAEAPPLGYESPLQVFGHQAAKVPDVTLTLRPGTPLDVKHPEEPANEQSKHSAFEVSRGSVPRAISTADFIARLVDETGPISTDLNRLVKNAYPDGINVDEVEDLISEIKTGNWRPAASRQGSGAASGE